MKSKIILYVNLLLGLCLGSCELDNYDAPDAQFFGSVVDDDTNEPIQQDLLEGSRIDFVETGFENPSIRQIRFHTDGTFRENNLFSGAYEVRALRGNFFPTEKTTIDIHGETEYHFRVLPYIRIRNVDITFDELRGMVTATFTLDQVSGNPVASVHLMADRNPNLSNVMRNAMVSRDVNAVVSPERQFQLEMSTEYMDSGKDYYFRVAALISGIGEAKHNYSVPVKLTIDNSKVVPEPPEVITGKVLDACESTDGWGGNFAFSLDASYKKEGNYSLKAEGTGVVIYQKQFEPMDAEITRENGILAFYLYVDDVSVFGAGEGSIEITSSGTSDQQEISWNFSQMNLVNGWNRVELKLSEAVQYDGDANIHALNFFRMYCLTVQRNVSMNIDCIRFIEPE
jgi:hypothetical protein